MTVAIQEHSWVQSPSPRRFKAHANSCTVRLFFHSELIGVVVIISTVNITEGHNKTPLQPKHTRLRDLFGRLLATKIILVFEKICGLGDVSQWAEPSCFHFWRPDSFSSRRCDRPHVLPGSVVWRRFVAHLAFVAFSDSFCVLCLRRWTQSVLWLSSPSVYLF